MDEMPKTEVRLKIDESVRDEFKAACALNRKTMSEVVEEFMKLYVKKTKDERNQDE
jgi:antitoxin component of RelBE/YafQ-DinJ toxin-antitoxin module